MMQKNTKLGDRIKQARQNKGLTQREFSDLLGCNLRTAQRYETAKAISTDTLLDIATITDVSSFWLLTGEGEITDSSVLTIQEREMIEMLYERGVATPELLRDYIEHAENAVAAMEELAIVKYLRKEFDKLDKEDS